MMASILCNEAKQDKITVQDNETKIVWDTCVPELKDFLCLYKPSL